MKLTSILIVALLILASCKDDFLDIPLQGELDEATVASSRESTEQLVIGAYAALDGLSLLSAWWGASHTNFIWGDVTSDDAYMGRSTSSINFGPGIAIETFTANPDHKYILDKWRSCYDGVLRCNLALQALVKASDHFSETEIETLTGEVLFLRGFYHFEAIKVWGNIPFISSSDQLNIENSTDKWPLIEKDLEYAYEHLPLNNSEVGRATKYAAAALLAKAYLFQHDYEAAKPLLDDIITNGGYQLVQNIIDNYTIAGNNNSESLFEIQASIEGSANGYAGNLANIYNLPDNDLVSGQGGGGVLMPSQNLVNAFKTDNNGLPMLDNFNNSDVTSDEGLLPSDPFTPYSGNLDPRIDYTVGRRGIPFLDWGIHEGWNWTKGASGTSGPYTNKKYVFSLAEKDQGLASTGAQGWIFGNTSANHKLIRYAQVLLWAAEVEVEIGDLEVAREYVNRIRRRAKNSEWVQNGGSDAANYVINEYSTPWTDQSFARKAVQFETRLELALEGQRFFDLVRWGIAPVTLNNYFEKEKDKRVHLISATFTAGKNEYFPIPQQELDLNKELKQNPGY